MCVFLFVVIPLLFSFSPHTLAIFVYFVPRVSLTLFGILARGRAFVSAVMTVRLCRCPPFFFVQGHVCSSLSLFPLPPLSVVYATAVPNVRPAVMALGDDVQGMTPLTAATMMHEQEGSWGV